MIPPKCSDGCLVVVVEQRKRATGRQGNKKVLFELISQHTGQPLERVETDADRDRWFTADQALEYGFIDKVVGSARQVADQGRPARQD